MKNLIERYYLKICSKKSLVKSKSKEKNLEITLEKKPTVDFCKFLYKEVGRDFFLERQTQVERSRLVGLYQ